MQDLILGVFVQLLPFLAWLFLLIITTFITWLFYLITSSIKANVAWLQGPIGKFTVKFGGPAALFFALIFLSRPYLPTQAVLITLSGTVTDVNNHPVDGASVVSAYYAGKTDDKGRFKVRVPYSANGQYDLVAYNNFDFKFEKSVEISDKNEVDIKDYPDPDHTTVVLSKNLVDRDKKPINGVRILVELKDRPHGALYTGDDSSIEIDRKRYSVAILDKNGKELSREDFNMPVGGRFVLPSDITLKGE